MNPISDHRNADIRGIRSLRSAAIAFAGLLALVSTRVQAAPPAAPEIAWLPASIALQDGQAGFTLEWNIWWGNNGDLWRLRDNGNVVHEATLTPDDPNAQNASTAMNYTSAGSHTLEVEVCRASECTRSATRNIEITGAGGGDGGNGDDGLVWPAPMQEHNRPYDNTSGKVVGSYFVEWGVYGRAFPVRDIPAANLTHLLYAFIAICGPNDALAEANPQGYAALVNECADQDDYTVTIHDRWAALEMSYPGDAFDAPIRGNFGQLQRLKQARPQLKILPSVGGWTLSDPFFHLAGDPARRATFIASLVDFLEAYPFFDGIDLDWEYPGGGGANGSLGGPADRAAYSTLLTELRSALDALGVQNERYYLLTAAVGAAPARIDAVDYGVAGEKLDLVFAMSYDYYGAWSGDLGHHAGLYPVAGAILPGYSSHETMNNLLAAGVPADKLVMGFALYGRGWQGVTGVQGQDPFTGTGSGAAPGTWEAGVLDYRHIENDFTGGAEGTGVNGYTAGYDAVAEAAWAWNPTLQRLITFESPRSARAKGEYVMQHGLAGLFGWEIDADNGNLLNAVHEGLGHSEASDLIFADAFEQE